MKNIRYRNLKLSEGLTQVAERVLKLVHKLDEVLIHYEKRWKEMREDGGGGTRRRL